MLHEVVGEHLETWLAAKREGELDVPGFVERDFRKYVTCGVLAQGLGRARCPACGHDVLVALSCRVIDGVFAPDAEGRVQFHEASGLGEAEQARVKIKVRARVLTWRQYASDCSSPRRPRRCVPGSTAAAYRSMPACGYRWGPGR